jgi:hypothetical protein
MEPVTTDHKIRIRLLPGALSRQSPRVLAGMPTGPRQPATFRVRIGRRSPPWGTVFAPILTREHAYEDDEADESQDERDDPGGYPVVELRGHGGTLRRSHWRVRESVNSRIRVRRVELRRAFCTSSIVGARAQ